MGTCSRCGNPVEFRYINGRCIPLHINGGCGDSTDHSINDYSGHNVCRESNCFCTNCPDCGQEVFFIRHNGGSVWIDPPLGPPWYKHSCFDVSPVHKERGSLFEDYKESFGRFSSAKEIEKVEGFVIGVTKSTNVDFSKAFTEIEIETGKSSFYRIKIKFNAGFLLSKLCVYDTKNSVVWPLYKPEYKFTVMGSKFHEFLKCDECGVMVNPKNMKKHLSKVHGRS